MAHCLLLHWIMWPEAGPWHVHHSLAGGDEERARWMGFLGAGRDLRPRDLLVEAVVIEACCLMVLVVFGSGLGMGNVVSWWWKDVVREREKGF
jgi:hypothetical protein